METNVVGNRQLSIVPKVICEWPSVLGSTHARLWFDQTVCNLPAAAGKLKQLEHNAYLLSGGKLSMDLCRLEYGIIDFYSNPTLLAPFMGVEYNLNLLNRMPAESVEDSPEGVLETGILAIDECVRLIRATCASSRGFDPELYPDELRQIASDR